MEDRQKTGLPIWAIFLDVLGTLVLVLGIYAQIAGDDFLASASIDSHALSIVLIIAGILLMLPLVIAVIKRAAASRQ
ncbi:MAG: DUF1418 family protein [Woeseiaceae bacterium]|nr:DUF1418 family protein [Woeseiaceae bacterium]